MRAPRHVGAARKAVADGLVDERNIEDAIHVASNGLSTRLLLVTEARAVDVSASTINAFRPRRTRREATLRARRSGLPAPRLATANDGATPVTTVGQGLTNPLPCGRTPRLGTVARAPPFPPSGYLDDPCTGLYRRWPLRHDKRTWR